MWLPQLFQRDQAQRSAPPRPRQVVDRCLLRSSELSNRACFLPSAMLILLALSPDSGDPAFQALR
jgi:hypothetical protein